MAYGYAYGRCGAWALGAALVFSLGMTVGAQPRPTAPGMPGDPYDPAPREETEAPADAGAGPMAVAAVTVLPLLDGGAAIARGRAVVVTAGELYDRLRDAPPVLLHTYATDPMALQGLVDRLLGDRLLAQEAVRRGLDRDPTVRAALERALVARLRATVINPQAGDGSGVTESDVRGWYDTHPERFHVPERRRARVIFVSTRREALAVLRFAQARRRGRVVNDFRALAAERNTVPALRAVAGEIREVTPGMTDIDRALRDAVFEVPHDGDVLSRVVPGRWAGTEGCFVVRLVSHRAAIERTLSDSAEWIRQRIVLERRVAAERAFIDVLSRDAGVTRLPMDRAVHLETADPNGGVMDGGVMDGGVIP